MRDERWETLMPEVARYEPRVALTGGEDGLDHIRELVASLSSGTPLVALEHADDQAEAVRAMLDETLCRTPASRTGTASPSAAP